MPLRRACEISCSRIEDNTEAISAWSQAGALTDHLLPDSAKDKADDPEPLPAEASKDNTSYPASDEMEVEVGRVKTDQGNTKANGGSAADKAAQPDTAPLVLKTKVPDVLLYTAAQKASPT